MFDKAFLFFYFFILILLEKLDMDLNKTTEITEGKATILFENINRVFYNKVQEFNRDMSIVIITDIIGCDFYPFTVCKEPQSNHIRSIISYRFLISNN